MKHIVELKEEWAEASKYVHTTTSRKGWKITATWLEKEELGRIRRIK